MSVIARQSTARIVMVGPILDADGVAVTTAVIGDLKLSKNGGVPAAFNASATLTHRHTGYYSLAYTASDADTVGQAEVTIDATTNAMPVKVITVVEEAVYDALFAASATGLLPANVTQISGSTSGVAAMSRAIDAIAIGTVDAGSTTTVINLKSITPTASIDKLNGRILLFPNSTTTANLRAQGGVISDMTATTITLSTPLTDAPAEDDIFVIQ